MAGFNYYNEYSEFLHADLLHDLLSNSRGLDAMDFQFKMLESTSNNMGFGAI